MPTLLPTGANTALQQTQYKAVFTWTGADRVSEGLVPVALFLGADGKIIGDEAVIGLDEKSHPSDALRIKGTQIDLNLAKVPEGVEKIILAIGVQEGSHALLDLSLLETLELTLVSPDKSDEVFVQTNFVGTTSRASISCEIYLKNGQWKVRALSQSYADGIPALVARYGLLIAEAARVTGVAHAAEPLVRPDLGQGQVFKPNQLGAFPEFHVTLTWASGQAQTGAVPDGPLLQPSKGLFKSLLGGPRPPKTMDLDLCCLFELSDGYRGIVQSLGDKYGSFGVAPFMELMGDIRGKEATLTPSPTAHEKIRVNGARFSEIRRAIFYAMIFDGAVDWPRAAGRVSLSLPDQVPVSTRLEGDAGRACSALMIENINGNLVVHKCVNTFRTPRDLDRHFGWGLAWASGTKD